MFSTYEIRWGILPKQLFWVVLWYFVLQAGSVISFFAWPLFGGAVIALVLSVVALLHQARTKEYLVIAASLGALYGFLWLLGTYG